MNFEKADVARPFGIVILVATILACFVDSALFWCSALMPYPLRNELIMLAFCAMVAEIAYCAILVSTLRMPPELRIVATFVVALILAGPMAVGAKLAQLSFVTPGIGPPSRGNSSFLIPLLAIPLLISALGCALHVMRIHRGMMLTLTADASSSITTAIQNVREYASVAVTVGLSALLIYLTWPTTSLRSENLLQIEIVIVVGVLCGGVLLLPITMMIFKLPWHWLYPFLFVAMLALGSRYGISFLVFTTWQYGLSTGEWVIIDIVKAAFQIGVSLLQLFLFLAALRLIGFRLIFQSRSLQPQRPKPVAIHPLDR